MPLGRWKNNEALSKTSQVEKNQPPYSEINNIQSFRRNKIIILGMDTFRHKNISQITSLNQQGYIFDLYTMDVFKDSAIHFSSLLPTNKLFKLKTNFLPQLNQIIWYLYKQKNIIHHVEIYPTARYSFVYTALCKLFNIKNIVIERGDIKYWFLRRWVTKILARFVYLNADIVWYKEPYMAPLLANLGVKKMKIIPNAVSVPDKTDSHVKDIDFLWVNRVIDERRLDWVINCLYTNQKFTTVILGYDKSSEKFLSFDMVNLLSQLNYKHHFQVFPYTNPFSFYARAKFFIFPSSYVYGNYGLLEAMSYGVVPIVSETIDTSKIVKNNVNGITFKNDYESFVDAINKAITMDKEIYEQLSRNAKESIHKDFSLKEWLNKVIGLYRIIAN